MSKIYFLGTGTSSGVPQIGCNCAVCRSSDPRDARLRTSVVFESDAGKRFLFDCGPDFRTQLLRQPFSHLDAVFLTHEHYDHVGGLEDLRPYSTFGDVPVYTNALCAAKLKQRLSYLFADDKYPGIAQLNLKVLDKDKCYQIEGEQIQPIEVFHGKLPITGYRIANCAFITDMSRISDKELHKLNGLNILILNALRQYPHHSHQMLSEALDLIEKIKPRETYLIHMSHQMGLHAEVEARLPSHVHLAYDGLVLDL